MAQYISKSALVAEIESLRCTSFTNFDEGVNATVQTLLETLDTLEVKEVDLDLEITLWANAIPEIRLDDVERLAKHFFELGIKVRQ